MSRWQQVRRTDAADRRLTGQADAEGRPQAGRADAEGRWQQARWMDAMSRIDLDLIEEEFPERDLQIVGAEARGQERLAAETARAEARGQERLAAETARAETRGQERLAAEAPEAPESGRRALRRRVGLWLAAASGIAATSIAITTVAVMAGRRKRQPA